MALHLLENQLSKSIYRRLLILTDAWPGERASLGSLLVKCYTGGVRLPLFWCGGPDNLVSFNEVFGQDRPLYCLCGTWGVFQPTDDNIRSLAIYYLAEILSVQPHGPYLLGGYCSAGLIAYEIAKLLQDQGYEVGTLILFDMDVTDQAPPLKIARQSFRLIENFFKRKIEFSQNPIGCIKSILDHKQSQLNAHIAGFKQKLRGTAVEKNTAHALYLLSEYSGAVELIYVKWGLLGYFQFGFFQRYWRKLVLGGLRLELVSGYVHNKPDWMTVAKIIQARLKERGY